MSGDAASGIPADALRWPLSEAQRGLWFAQRVLEAPPGSSRRFGAAAAAFNTAHAIWFEGGLDLARFTAAADTAAAEAEALRLRMAADAEGVPWQWLDPAHVPLLQVVDVSTAADPEQAVRDAMQAERLRPVDPARDRLARQRLYVLGPQRVAWYVRVHHLATDGYGMALFSARVCALYNGGDSEPLQPLRPVLDEDAQYQADDRRERDAAHWHAYLQGATPAEGLGGGTAAAAADAHRFTRPVDAALRERLLSAAQAIGQPWPDLLTALTAEYCRRYSAAEEVMVGVPFMGRLGSASARVPAMVMNVLPLRVGARDDDRIDASVRDTARSLVRGRRHGRYRGEQLRRDLGWVGLQHRLHGPLVNVQPFYRPLPWQGVTAQLEVLCTGPVDDITLGFRGDAVSALVLEVEANPARHAAAELPQHAERLLHFVSAALEVQARGGTLGEVALCTPAEEHRWVHEVNATGHAVPDVSLVALLLARMAATPDATALVFEGESLSYAALERRSRALALQLQALGVGRESRVVVALPRSLSLLVALVAVLRAGGAYLPVDLEHPDARLRRILDSAAPQCVLVESADAARFEGYSVLSPAQWHTDSKAALPDTVQPDDAAYLIYTSGSTGEPKGVLVEHRAIVNRLEWMRCHYAVDAQARVLQKTPATFDVSVWEFFLPLVSGASLVIAPPWMHRDPQALTRLIRDERISILHFVPSMLDAWLAVPDLDALPLQQVFTSGEALDAGLRDRFHARVDAELHNLYGPTEAAVDVSFWPASREDRSDPVPIGYPVWNTQLYVLDARLRPLPAGVAGDLYLGGVQLARGYLGRDDLTAERFLANPHLPGGRLYRSGDRARWREDGALEYLGRSDHQVKLRGLRIELGEIEAALRSAPGVARAEVLLHAPDGMPARLLAYVSGVDVDAAAVQAAARAQLPDYMVPSPIMVVSEWPVTSNGKLDRNALPLPEVAEGAGRTAGSPTEHVLATLFQQALGLPAPVPADADFFALGGDSLSAVHLLLAIQQRWQRDPGLGAIFATPTVAGLAAHLDAAAQDTDHGLGPTLVLARGEPGRAPLFVIHPAGGIAWNYRTLARALGPGRDVHGLQSPALDATAPLPDSIEALAADYASRIAALHPQGPVHLLGWSVGGIIAQAIAVHLQAHGREAGALVLLDAYPSECWRAEPEPDAVAALRALLAIAGHDPEQHPELDSRERIVAFLRQGDSALGNLPEPVLDGVVRAVTGTNRLIREHHHRHYNGTLVHVRAGNDHVQRPHLQSALWQAHAARVEALPLPFLHAELTGREAVAQLAPWLSARLQHWDVLQQDHMT